MPGGNFQYNPNIDIPKSNTAPDFSKSVSMQGADMSGDMSADMMASNYEMLDQAESLVIDGKGGTDIMSLRKEPEPNRFQYNPNMDLYPPQPKTQTQPSPQQKSKKQVFRQSRQAKEKQTISSKIKNLANDINQSLDDYLPSISMYSDTDTDSDIDIDLSHTKSSRIPLELKEIIIIIIIYVFMSQKLIKNHLSKYISYLQPDDDGMIQLSGYIVYGSLIALLFVIIKKIVIKI